MRILISIAVFFGALQFSASAEEMKPILGYDCEIRQVVTEDSMSFEDKVFVPSQSGAHGGEVRPIQKGNYRVEWMADERWLGLSWWLNDELLAEGVFLIASGSKEPRIALFYNPKKQDEQLSISCSPRY